MGFKEFSDSGLAGVQGRAARASRGRRVRTMKQQEAFLGPEVVRQTQQFPGGPVGLDDIEFPVVDGDSFIDSGKDFFPHLTGFGKLPVGLSSFNELLGQPFVDGLKFSRSLPFLRKRLRALVLSSGEVLERFEEKEQQEWKKEDAEQDDSEQGLLPPGKRRKHGEQGKHDQGCDQKNRNHGYDQETDRTV